MEIGKMRSMTRTSLHALVGVTGIVLLGLAMGAGSAGDASNQPGGDNPAATGKPGPVDQRLRVEAARDRAKLMHDIYEATLDTMHHHYFERGQSVLPARAMEDVFAKMSEKSKIRARWIAVSLKAMSLDHEPKGPFDKKAVEEISAGKGEFERVEGGYYHRAGAIPLASGCVGCHAGFSSPPPRSPSFAGLVISIPLNAD
jgi:hypothetical protein